MSNFDSSDETQAARLLRSLPDAVLVVAADGRLMAANPSAESLIGTIPSELRRLGAMPGFAPNDRRKLLDAHGERCPAAVNWRRAGMRYRATLRPMPTGGEMLLMLCPAPTLADEADGGTDLAGLRGELDRLQAMDEVKSGVIARVAQEIRAPLASIKSFAKILWMNGDRLEPARRQAFLQIVNSETDRLTRLIEDVLDIARMEAGTMLWRVEQVDLADVVEQSLAANRSAAQQKGVTLTLDPTPLPRLPVRGDRDKLLQAVSHLIVNGIKFTPEGGRVTISGSLEAAQVQLKVQDTGIGLSPAEQQRVFEPYYQVAREADGDGPQDGVGLGLSIVRQIATHASGRVRVESEPNAGSTFFLSFPAAV